MKWLLRVVSLLILPVLAAAAGTAWWLHKPLSLKSDKVQIVVAPGASARDVAHAAHLGGVDVPPLLLSQWFRWSGQERRIRPGRYEIDRSFTPAMLLNSSPEMC